MVDNLNIERIELVDLKPADYNPRKISKKNRDKLKKSLDEFGLVEPLVINLKDNKLISGHQRFDLLLESNVESVNLIRKGDIGWVFPDEDLIIKDENHEKALNLALNRISGEWDIERLTPLLDELEDLDLAPLTGFDMELEEVDVDFVKIPEKEEIIEDTFVSNQIPTVHEPKEEVYEEEEEEDNLINVSVDKKSDKIPEPIQKETPVRTSQGFVNLGDVYKIDNNIILCEKEADNLNIKSLLNNKLPSTSLNNYDLNFVKVMGMDLNLYITENPKILEEIIQSHQYVDIIKL